MPSQCEIAALDKMNGRLIRSSSLGGEEADRQDSHLSRYSRES